MSSETYFGIGLILGLFTSALTFLGSWIYCIITYGFLFGVGLGWLPSAIVAAVVFGVMYVAWPLLIVGIVGFALYAYALFVLPQRLGLVL